MARRAPTVTRPADSLRRSVDAHRALVDPAAATELEHEHAEQESAAEARRERRRAQPRDKGGKFK